MNDRLMSLYVRTLGLGAIAGLRSLTAPALLSRAAAGRHDPDLSDTPFAKLADPAIAETLGLAAAGEMIVDKLPFAPNRTIPPSVAFRAASGAFVGAALFAGEKRSPAAGAVVGALAAVAATYGAFVIRRALDRETGLPDPVIGLVEDVIAVDGGNDLLRS
jgi:uncharacterized membrane protein